MPFLLIYHCIGDKAVKYSVCLRTSIQVSKLLWQVRRSYILLPQVLTTPTLVNVTSEYSDFCD